MVCDRQFDCLSNKCRRPSDGSQSDCWHCLGEYSLRHQQSSDYPAWHWKRDGIHGVLMAARLNPRHQEMVRDKIRASQLVNALENHVLKGTKMQPSQVTAALGLLKKCVPDLTNTEHNASNELLDFLKSLSSAG